MAAITVQNIVKTYGDGFQAVKDGALRNGALGCSISGAGPTVFAWCEEPQAAAVRDAMVAAFAQHGLDSDAWISTLDPAGARVIEQTDGSFEQ